MSRIASFAVIAIAMLLIRSTIASPQTEVPVDPQLQAELESWKPALPKMEVAIDMSLRTSKGNLPTAARGRGRGSKGSPAVTSQENFDAVLDWLAQNGFQVTEGERSANSYVRFTATAERAEKTFKVKVIASPDGKRYACRGEPAVPAPLQNVASFITISNVETYESAP